MTHLSEAILRQTNGATLVLHDPLIVQHLHQHYDFVLLDCAARPCETSVVAALQLATGDTPFLVRPSDIGKFTLQGLLSLGVDGLVLPDILHAAELEKAIAACLYPPEGIRPYRPTVGQEKNNLQALNDQITFIVEIAHPQTMTQLEEIAEVTGLNGFLVNPQRLSVAMEKGGDTGHAQIQQALKTVARIAASYELAWGIEGEEMPDLNPDFNISTRDIDLLLGGMQKKTISAATSFIADKDDEDDYSPFMLAARRE